MDRRKFLQQIAIGASLTAASPLFSEVIERTGDSVKKSAGWRGGSLSTHLLQSELSKGFVQPPASAAPWVYWVWLGVDTTPAAMTYDLEQMKAKGIAGFILYGNQAGSLPREIPARVLVEKDNHFDYEFIKNGDYDNFHTTPVPFPALPAWTPLWRERIRYVANEAARLDLKFCLTIGLAGTSASIPEEYGNQELVWSETAVSGPGEFNGVLAAPEADNKSKKKRANGGQSDYRREVAVLAVPSDGNVTSERVIDLASEMDASGHLKWTIPAGNWRILRFAQVATGARNEWGYFSDVMNPEALDKLWEVTMAPLLREMSPDERKGLMGLEDDSWEGGKFTWTKNFPEEFRRRRGYDLIPYLPVLVDAGSTAIQQQIERDYKLTISDLMADHHYGHLEQLCKKNGLIFFSEAAGPNLHQADLLKTTSEVDIPMAEFWVPCFHRPRPKSRYLARNAACASHIYGMPVNMDEAFTSLGPEWEESPFDMKPEADQAFCDGVNRICVHNFSHSPSLTAKPGYVYIAGTHYEPRITWWEQAPAFNTYLARCSYMLQQGKFVADAIFYKGDNLGDGEAMKEIHPALGEGYDYDCCNRDVLLTRMKVKDGRIVLRDGMSYRVLILPDSQPMALDALEKIASLIDAGATVVGHPPSGLAGLAQRPGEVQRFGALVRQVWGDNYESSSFAKRKIGAGVLVSGQSARQTLADAKVPPDFEHAGLSPAGEIHWIHRKMDHTDIYFIANHWPTQETLECTFRILGRQPELWDPVTGEMRDAIAFRQSDGRTIVPLEFAPRGSVFVVFRKPLREGVNGFATTNYTRNERVQLELSDQWKVSFNSKWGGPESIVFDQLADWSMRPEPGIKYYSGTAVYRKRFNLPLRRAKSERVLLDLGELRDVGEVRLNGHDLGVVWTKPARLDITDFVKARSNDLEVSVVNLWPNRLIGDAGLPTGAGYTETNVRKFSSHSPLRSSGLIGPVQLLLVEGSA